MGGCKLCGLHDGAILQLDPLDGLVATGKKKLPLISCCGNQGELMLYLCFFKLSRNYLRGFLIAA